MTAEPDLLPLPSMLLNWPHPTNHAAIRDYARANVAHAVAPLQAEIEALREDAYKVIFRIEQYASEQEREPIVIPSKRLRAWASDLRAAIDQARGKGVQPAAADAGVKTCYQCNRPVTWLAPDSRCGDCTRLTPDEVGG